MDSKASLEQLLQTLVNTPEKEKRSLTRSAITMLREVCNMHKTSNYPKFKESAEYVKNILDQILIGKLDDDEEEFLASGSSSPLVEKNKKVKKQPERIFIEDSFEEYKVPSDFQNLLDHWNKKADSWMQLEVEAQSEEEFVEIFVKRISALRSNLVSAALANQSDKTEVKRLEQYWKICVEKFHEKGYQISHSKFGRLKMIEGDAIYSCRPRLKSKEVALLLPGVKKDGNTFVKPLTLVTLPAKEAFPENHPDKDLPAHWRAVLGDLELLIKHIEFQSSTACAIESINKTRVAKVSEHYQNLISEAIRRGDALRDAIRKEKSIYRLATNYWRVEELFWGVFHDDGRPIGHSFFDRLRRRIQGWHNNIRKSNQLYIRNFDASNDTLASINKYIGNIILKSKQGIPPGTILRELRPAVIVKVNNVTRLLKGRVIAT